MGKVKGDAFDKMRRARVKLVMDQPFFGMLTLSQLRLELREDLPAPMGTDGRVLYFRSAEVLKWSLSEVCAVICHEVLHAANGHNWRVGGRDKWRWNVAADFAINPVVKECGLTLPQGCLFKEEWAGKAAEEIYRLLPKDLNKLGLPNDPLGRDLLDGMCGEDGKPLSEADKRELEHKWKQAVQQAVQAAKMQGKVPAGLERMVGEALKPQCDWKALLARFVQNAAKADYSWKRPNRRYLSAGVWLPSLYSEQMRPIVVAIDTSGSVGEAELQVFVSELNGIISAARPERTHLLWADAEVAGVQTFELGDPIVCVPKGGGGTDFRPVFDWVREQTEDEPACLIYLTDMYGTFPSEAPGIPTMWVATSDVVGPFGETIKLEQSR